MYGLLYFLVILSSVRGAHFRGGSITWSAVQPTSPNSTNITVEIKQIYSWSYTRYPCNTTIGDLSYVVCISINCSNYANTSVNTQTPCYSSDINFDVSTGHKSTIIYLNAGSRFVIAFQSNAWFTLVSSSSSSWSITTLIDLRIRNDTGRINSSPTAIMSGIITVPRAIQSTLRVPMEDDDLDFVQCRWANSTALIESTIVNECAGVCQNLPGSQLYSSLSGDNNCTIVFTGAQPGYYVVALQIEDFMPSALTDPPLSSVPLQFLILVLNISCYSPTIIGQLPNGATIGVEMNTKFTMTLLARLGCNNSYIDYFFTTVYPSGVMNTTAVTQIDSMLYSIDFTWTPTSALIGSKQVYCTMAVDSNRLQSAQYCLNFMVYGNLTTPTTTTTTTSATIRTTTQATYDFSVVLGLALSLALLFVLSSVLLCGCYYWYPGLFRYSQKPPVVHQTRSIPTTSEAIEINNYPPRKMFKPTYSTQTSRNLMSSSVSNSNSFGDYRKQYINPSDTPRSTALSILNDILERPFSRMTIPVQTARPINPINIIIK